MEGLEEYQDLDDDFWNTDYSSIYDDEKPRDYDYRKKEIWLPIKNFDDKYLISNHGKIKSLWDPSKPKILKTDNYKGWQRADLIKYRNEDRFSIRRSIALLVAQTFIENPNNYSCIGFEDDDFHNIYFENIYWTFSSYLPEYEKVPYIKQLPPFKK